MEPLDRRRTLLAALALSDLSSRELWIKYVAMGGSLSETALEAHLDGSRALPPHEHDLAAQALNEYCVKHGLSDPAAYYYAP